LWQIAYAAAQKWQPVNGILNLYVHNKLAIWKIESSRERNIVLLGVF